jgi:hypothetical protein
LTRKKSVIERTAECKRLIDSGMSLREACKKADIDDKTYKRNLPLLDNTKREQGDTMHTTVKEERAIDNEPTPGNVKPYTKRKQILIRVPIDIYDYLAGEAEKTGYKLSSVAASRVIMSVRKDMQKNDM